jgi:hypothetical protein
VRKKQLANHFRLNQLQFLALKINTKATTIMLWMIAFLLYAFTGLALSNNSSKHLFERHDVNYTLVLLDNVTLARKYFPSAEVESLDNGYKSM